MIAPPPVEREEIRVADYLWSERDQVMQAAALTARVVRALGARTLVVLSFRDVRAVDSRFLEAFFGGLHVRYNAAWLGPRLLFREAGGDLGDRIEAARNAVTLRSSAGYRPAI